MKRLRNKCLAASAFTHGLVLLMLVVGSAFVSRKPKPEAPSFELFAIPAMLVDEPNVVGGGNPEASSPPQIPAQPPVTPAPQPVAPPKVEPQPETKPPEPVTEPVKEPVKAPVPEPVKPEVQNKQPDPESFDFNKVVQKPKPVPAKPQNTFNLADAKKLTVKPAEGKSSPDNEKNNRAERETQAAKARAGALSDALKRVQGGLSSVGNSYDIPGPGGAAYAAYELALKKIYYDAWIPPQAATDGENVVETEIVIQADGTVLSRRIIKKSGKAQLDRSVQDTLNRVKKVPPFPSGTKDEKRTYPIHFNLGSKLQLG